MGQLNPEGDPFLTTTFLMIGVPQLVTPALLLFTSFVRDQLYKYNRILAFSKALTLIASFYWFLTAFSLLEKILQGNWIVMVQLIPPVGVIFFDLILFIGLLLGSSDPEITKPADDHLPGWSETAVEEE